MTQDSIRVVEQYLSGSRLAHVFRVADTAVGLAKRWNASQDEAYLAGVLHDVAKPLNPELMHKEGIVVSDQNRALFAAYPRVWHAFAAPVLLQHVLPGLPESILDAVQWHTTGTADMSLLAQIIYVADFIEPERAMDCVDYVRELAMENLGKAISAISLYSFFSLVRQGDVIHPALYTCLDFYRSTLSREESKAIAVAILG
jgi:predicted HD superfamily hydrolase involved in NAD metabolism